MDVKQVDVKKFEAENNLIRLPKSYKVKTADGIGMQNHTATKSGMVCVRINKQDITTPKFKAMCDALGLDYIDRVYNMEKVEYVKPSNG